MEEKNKVSESTENNFIEYIWYKFFPFWPLFALLSLLLLVLAFVFVLNIKPTHTVSATIAINNEENTIHTNQSFRALDAYASRQIVDNEVLILHSRALMKNVVNNLSLYAPTFEKQTLTKASAYLSSPVTVEALEPDRIHKKEKIFFEYDSIKNSIRLENKNYLLNEWVKFPFGTIRFVKNSRKMKSTDKPLYFSLINPTVVADGLLKNLTVGAVSKLSTVIDIAFQADTPEKGEDIVNELLREYMRKSVANENLLAANTLTFVEERLSDVENELDSIERRIEQFRSARGVVDLSEQGRIALESVAENDRRITDINSQLAVLEQVQRYVNAQDPNTGIVPTTLGIDDPVLARLLQRLNDLELQLANTKTTTGENNPLVTSLENEIQKIRPNISTIVSNQRERLLAGRKNLVATSNRFTTDIRSIPQQERELLEISRQQAVKRDLYSFLLQRREEAALSNAATIANNRIVDWADASVAKASSVRLIVLIGSVVMAFGLGIAYIFYKEGLTGKTLFRSDIEKLSSLPVVAEINNIEKWKGLPGNDVHSMLSPQLFQLQMALNLNNAEAKNKKILLTSALPNEGKTFIVNNLAISLANSGRKVVIVDFDFFSSAISSLYNLSANNGIKEFLSADTALASVVYNTRYGNLDVLPAGASKENKTGWLLDRKVGDLFIQLESRYDFILVDTPPVELTTDAYILSEYANITLFVLRHNTTPASTIEKLESTGKLNSFKKAAIIFNDVKGRGFIKKYYGYKIGYGYENPVTTQYSRKA